MFCGCLTNIVWLYKTAFVAVKQNQIMEMKKKMLWLQCLKTVFSDGQSQHFQENLF